MSFARAEILPRTTVPVFFGAASFDPRLDLAALVERIAEAGFAGISNFPTAILIDGAYRRFLENVGLGFERELELLSLAKARGLVTLAYAHTRDEAVAAARRGVDIVNIDLGWNKGGVLGVDTFVRIEEASLTANTIARAVHAASPKTRCMVEGGPIVSPKQLEELCQIARVDGYVGGSTIDRVPSESAIEIVTAAFKAIGALQQRIDGLERRLDRRSFPRSLWGHSAAIESARALFARLATTDHAVTVVGEPGTGRREVARALHALSSRKGRDLVSVACNHPSPERARLDLFGCMAGAHPAVAKNRLGWLEIAKGSSILLDDVDDLPIEVQRALVEAAETRPLLAHRQRDAAESRCALPRDLAQRHARARASLRSALRRMARLLHHQAAAAARAARGSAVADRRDAAPDRGARRRLAQEPRCRRRSARSRSIIGRETCAS